MSRTHSLSPELDRIAPGVLPQLRHAAWLYGMTVVIAVPLAWLKGLPLDAFLRGGVAAAAVFVVLGAFLALVVRPLGIAIHADGLVARDPWGRKRFVSWSGIAEVRPVSVSGVTLAAIEPRDSGAACLWTSLDVLQNERFRSLVVPFAGEEHPLLGRSPDAAPTEPELPVEVPGRG